MRVILKKMILVKIFAKINIKFENDADFELNFAKKLLKADGLEQELLEKYAAWAIFSEKGRKLMKMALYFD